MLIFLSKYAILSDILSKKEEITMEKDEISEKNENLSNDEDNVSETVNEEAEDLDEAEDIEEISNDYDIEEELTDNEVKDDTDEEVDEMPKKKFNKKVVIIPIATVALVYLGGVAFYSSHFAPGTYINNVPCSNLTVEKAEEKIYDTVADYTYTIKLKNEKEEYIKGKDISLECIQINETAKAKETQNPFLWFYDKNNLDLDANLVISYDEDALFNCTEWLDCAVEARERLSDVTSRLVYENGEYTVSEENTEEVVDFARFYSLVKTDVYALKQSVLLEDEGLYVPEAQAENVREIIDTANRYVSSNITYLNGDEKYILTGDLINQWVSFGENSEVILDGEKVAEYVHNLAGSYDTVGKQREFVTSMGTTVTVGGGNFGWKVDQAAEKEALAELIYSGAVTEREPEYKQKGQIHNEKTDIYGTYVEISLSAQTLWFYKDTNLVITTPVVTGNPYAGNATPPGVFVLAYKARNAVLRGANYATPVSYWMPFNGGIGLHDATWRGIFGGSIYRGGGSHGCINLPFSAAAKIYEQISAGVPVVVY